MPNDKFYQSAEWRNLRKLAIKRDKWRCQHCGVMVRGPRMGESRPYVDHIKNRRLFPALALLLHNLQTLCAACHNRKTVAIDDSARAKPAIGADGYPIEE